MLLFFLLIFLPRETISTDVQTIKTTTPDPSKPGALLTCFECSSIASENCTTGTCTTTDFNCFTSYCPKTNRVTKGCSTQGYSKIPGQTACYEQPDGCNKCYCGKKNRCNDRIYPILSGIETCEADGVMDCKGNVTACREIRGTYTVCTDNSTLTKPATVNVRKGCFRDAIDIYITRTPYCNFYIDTNEQICTSCFCDWDGCNTEDHQVYKDMREKQRLIMEEHNQRVTSRRPKLEAVTPDGALGRFERINMILVIVLAGLLIVD